MNSTTQSEDLTLVLGGSGKTGRRVVDRLASRGVPTRAASRGGDPPFDWGDESTWGAALNGVTAAYISYAPDLAIPGATDAIHSFVERTVEQGVRRLVLLSGRGEEEAQQCELLIQRPEVEWTVVRASWFNQNFADDVPRCPVTTRSDPITSETTVCCVTQAMPVRLLPCRDSYCILS